MAESATIVWPKGMQVFERGWLSANMTVFTGTLNAVVDTGYVSHAALGLELLRRALGEAPLHRIVNTHLHSDHCGGNALLQRAYPQARTHIPSPEAEMALRWDTTRLSFEATGQRCDRFHVDRAFSEGDELVLGDLTFIARAARGHDPRMFVLWCPEERVLLSADALWEDGFGVIFPELEGEPGFDDVRATLNMIESLDVDRVVPGHGAPFIGIGAALERAHARLDYLAADPERNARHALKVLVKFLLLDLQRIALPDLTRRMAAMRYVREIDQRYLHQPIEAVAAWVVEALVRAGAATVEDGALVNR